MRGKFITFEGGEGAGKTTQISLLLDALRRANLPVLHTREPGGTDGAEAIRALLVQKDAEKWDEVAETLLFFAARREHAVKKILPALEAGTHVICDRFTDSTRVYQGFGKLLGDGFVQMLHRISVGTLQPDITLWLDMEVDAGLARTKSRAEAAQDDTETRFESLPTSFHERVRHGFQTIAAAAPQRMVRISANASIEAVHQHILSAINTHLALGLGTDGS